MSWTTMVTVAGGVFNPATWTFGLLAYCSRKAPPVSVPSAATQRDPKVQDPLFATGGGLTGVVAGAVVVALGGVLPLPGVAEDGVDPVVACEPAVLICAAITKEAPVRSAAPMTLQNAIQSRRWFGLWG
jgi:hypothetical protein